MTETPRTEDAHPVLSTTGARQGRYGKPVFWVLVVSTVLAALALFGAWAWKAPGLARPGSQQTVTSPAAAAAFSEPQAASPAPKQKPAGAPTP